MSRENLTGRTIASYRLIEQVGEGGTAVVYRGEHPEHGVCAVKVLRQASRSDAVAVKRFLREAAFGSRVVHENVVRTWEYGETDGFHFLALEWAEGVSLADHAARKGPMEPPEVASITSQLAAALAVAHRARIIHRDLKPENIIVNPETGRAKLLDFGIARDQQDDPAERLTRTGFFVGSLNYVAPEALSGELVNEAADIYSLATITYYLLSGAHPYGGRSPREIFQQLLTEEPQPLNRPGGKRFSKKLEAAVMKALSRDPSARHRTVEEFARELTAATGDGAAGGETESPGMLGRLKGLFRKP